MMFLDQMGYASVSQAAQIRRGQSSNPRQAMPPEDLSSLKSPETAIDLASSSLAAAFTTGWASVASDSPLQTRIGWSRVSRPDAP
jgi:hypothetical protein